MNIQNEKKEQMNASCDRIIERLEEILEKKKNDFEEQKKNRTTKAAEVATMTLFDIDSINLSIKELHKLKEDIQQL